MTLDETYQLLDRISLVDDRIVRADPAEASGQADMWTAILADVPLPFAAHAVLEHYKRSPFALRPSDVAEQWRRYVHDRLERHTESEPPAGDAGDDTYQAALFAERRAVAMGQLEPRPVTQMLPAGTGQVVGRARAILAAAIEHVPTARAGVVNVLGNACPRCYARPGQSCSTAGRKRADAHPARLEDARRIASGLPPADPGETAAELERRRGASAAALPPGTPAPEPDDGFQHPVHQEATAS